MRFFLLLLTTVLLTGSARAQSPEDSVKTAINALFTGMRNADTMMIKNCFADSAILQTIANTKQGVPYIKNYPVSSFVQAIGALPKNAADERISFEIVKTDGPLAIVWTPYSFYYNGKFSHCGVNSFQLVRLNGQWKIQYLIDTRRTQGCK